MPINRAALDQAYAARKKYRADTPISLYSIEGEDTVFIAAYLEAVNAGQPAPAGDGQKGAAIEPNKDSNVDMTFSFAQHGEDYSLVSINYPGGGRWNRAAFTFCLRDSEFMQLAGSVVSAIKLKADFGDGEASQLLQIIQKTIREQHEIDVSCGATTGQPVGMPVKEEPDTVEAAIQKLESYKYGSGGLKELAHDKAIEKGIAWLRRRIEGMMKTTVQESTHPDNCWAAFREWHQDRAEMERPDSATIEDAWHAAWNARSPERESRVEPDRNEQFKRLCKLGTDINMLIGAARSVSGMDKSHGVRKEWVDSLLAHADDARAAWDGIVAMFEAEDNTRRGSDD